MSKNRKHYPSAPTQYQVECSGVTKGGYNGITIFKDIRNSTGFEQGTSFVVGDEAEYSSYNLSYTGLITKITDKAVTIVAYPGSKIAVQHRLSIEEFCWRNFKFNAAETARKNHEEMMYI